MSDELLTGAYQKHQNMQKIPFLKMHTEQAAIESINTIDELRSKIVRNRVSIAVCCLTGDKWQSKTLFLAIFNPRSPIAKNVFDCQISGVM